MKYLITKSNIVKIFPDEVSHSTIAPKDKIKSAGYVKPTVNGIKTYGQSHSTGIKSKRGDAVKVARKLKELWRRREK